MKLGVIRFFEEHKTPEAWMALVKAGGYAAVSAPIDETSSDEEIAAYREIAEANDIVIAEVGVWKNTCSDDEAVRKANIATAKAKLRLADKLGARCAVNIVGERTVRGGADDLTEDAFERAVTVVREIIDDVQPREACYCLETMPYMLPDSVEMYVRMFRAIDREKFGVHCDPANFHSSPRNYHNSGKIIEHFFRELGPYIRSCHAKDILMDSALLVRFLEVMPGQGGLDYRTYIREINKLDPNMPLIIEHLRSDEDYRKAAAYLWDLERNAQ